MDSGRVRFSAADVEFMQGMIHHHAQAILATDAARVRMLAGVVRELGRTN